MPTVSSTRRGSESSVSTITSGSSSASPLTLTEICDNLSSAFKETDPLTLNTIIEVYSAQVIETQDTEGVAIFLERLYDELLITKEDLLREISWDLPMSLLSFVQVKYIDLSKHLLGNSVVPIIIGCFSELASRGNSKEMFLMACELLGKLNYKEEEEQLLKDGLDFSNELNIDRGAAEGVIDVKFHILGELIDSCLKRLTCQSPSRFLSIAITSFMTFIKNNIKHIYDFVFVLRRIFVFCRDYVPPAPQDASSFDSETENILQRKLLTYFLTTGLAECLQNSTSVVVHFAGIYYADEISKQAPLQTDDRHARFMDVCERIYNLAISLDIDIERDFIQYCIKDSCSVYENLANNSSEYILKIPATHDIIRMSQEKEIKNDYRGILVLAGYMHHTKNIKYPADSKDYELNNLIYMFMRFSSLNKVSQSINFNVMVLEDVCCNFLWYPLMKNSFLENQKQVSQLPSSILQTFYHLILLKIVSLKFPKDKIGYCTLLTRVLSLSPEKDIYHLWLDTLSSCPFSEIKCILTSIVKDLMTKTVGTQSLSKDMSNLNISKDDQSAKNSKNTPSLPPRTFLKVTSAGIDGFNDLTGKLISGIVEKPDSENLTELLAHLNFYIHLKKSWNVEYINNIRSRITKDIIENQDFRSDLPEYEFIKISIKAL